MIDFNELSRRCYQNAVACGFKNEELSDDHFKMLIITEVSEIVEAEREGRKANRNEFDRMITEGVEFAEAFKLTIKDSFEDELADVAIRIFHLAGMRQINLICDIESGSECDFSELSTETALWLVRVLCETITTPDIALGTALVYVWNWAQNCDINLSWHIEKKLEFNRTRGMKHGNKKY